MSKIEVAPSLNVPVLGFTHTLAGPDDGVNSLIVGFDGLTLDGKPFPYATAGDWVLTFPQDGLAVLQIPIVVTLPKDPAVSDA